MRGEESLATEPQKDSRATRGLVALRLTELPLQGDEVRAQKGYYAFGGCLVFSLDFAQRPKCGDRA